MCKALAIIPARGGSKGINRKNLFSVNGCPLIYWTIKAAKESKYISDIVVSSDDEEILEYSKRQGLISINRPSNLAKDESSMDSVISHSINELLSQAKEYDNFILLQPTSPLRDSEDINTAFEFFYRSNAKSLISVCKVNNKYLKSFYEDANGFIKGIANDNFPFMRRQDLPHIYLSNGAIYISSIKEYFKFNSFMTAKTIKFEMPINKSVDIDSLKDIDIAEECFKNILK